MRRFDCTARDCPLFGPHLLEASAGTGKTFSIEHVFVRLLLESEDPPIELEQILAVTFTRAAARELKTRIRSNLDRALAFLETPSSSTWEYLLPFAGSKEAMRRIRDARAVFDQCQIFTIHGFCYRILMEFAFEAHLGLFLPDPDRGPQISKQLKRAMRKFLETLNENLVCPEQMAILLKKYDSLDELSMALLKKGKTKREPLPFSETQRRFCQAIRNWNGERPKAEKLWEDFQVLEKGFKVAVKGNFQLQVFALAKALVSPEDRAPLRTLIREKASLFAFLAPSNRKVRTSFPEHLLSFFDKASQVFAPIIEEATDEKTIFETLADSWQKEALEPWWNPDEILRQMKQAIERQSFVAKVQAKYSAVIIDEFQDTDPLQWEIFRRLFLEQKSLRAFYLVGDPKQSIYRFRNADVYTYFEARDLLGEGALYSLDTNFRSSEKLLRVLNALFSKSRFDLPKMNRSISYQPVQAGVAIESFEDAKGAVHAVFSNEGFESAFLPYAVGEIERLLPQVGHPGAFAILVKDRYQAEAALKALSARNIPAFAKSHTPLGQTEAFQAIRELLEALVFPQDVLCNRIAEMGPFTHISLDREILREGLVPFFSDLGTIDFFNEADWKQVVEELLAWEQREGFSLEGLVQFLREFEKIDSDEGGRRRLESDENAVQILTLHISKGLEFDVVFAFGLATAQPEEEEEPEEIDAEKMRQLYVAMTRAKKRLYFPARISSESKHRSPMDLFCRYFEPSYFQTLAKQESFTFEEIATVSLSPLTAPLQKAIPERQALKPVPYRPIFLHSFTALAQEKERAFLPPQENSEFTIHSLPRGAETGIAIHQIFERLFSEEKPIWRDPQAIEALIVEELQFSSLKPWKKPIVQMVEEIVSAPLFERFSLKNLEPEMLQTEMEFLFAAPPHFIKGFIDLVFCWEKKYYLIDWKTNWLGESEKDYHPLALEKAMEEHDYWLQAALYAEALQRHLKKFPQNPIFGGALYVFIRGKAVHYFQPDLNLLNTCYARSC